MRFKYIKLSETTVPDYFENSYPKLPEAIVSSIKEIGITTPVQAIDTEEGYTVFSGCRRFHTAMKLKWEDIPAFIYNSKKITGLDALMIGVSENHLTRGLNDLEISNIIDVLENRFKTPGDEIIQKYSEEIGIQKNFSVFERYRSLKKLNESLKEYIYQKKIPLKHSASIASWTPSCQTKLSNLLKRCLLSHSEFMEIVILAEEISHIQKIKPGDAVHSSEIREILNDGKQSQPEKARKLLTLLRKRRFPETEKLRSGIKSAENKLSSGNLKVKFPELLEGNGIKIELTVKNCESLGDAGKKIGSDLFLQEIKKLFKDKIK